MPHGNETRLYGDSAHIEQKEILNQLAPKAKDFTNCSTTRIRQHYSCTTQVLVHRFHRYISQKALAILPPPTYGIVMLARLQAVLEFKPCLR